MNSKHNLILITALLIMIGLIGIVANLNLISAGGFLPVNNTVYILHNETDSQFSSYEQMKNVSTDNVTSTSNAAAFTSTQVVTCWNTPGWIAPNWSLTTRVNGTWNFTIYTNCSNNFNVNQYWLMAEILKVNSTGGYNIVNTTWTTFACAAGAAAARTWISNLAFTPDLNLSSGERIGAYICANVTGGQGAGRVGRMYWENVNPSSIMFPAQSLDDIFSKVTLIAPPDNTITSVKTVFFAANFSDNVYLKNATVYVWNSSNSAINTTSNFTLTGAFNSTNISVSLPYQGIFNWSYYVCDNQTNCIFDNNRTLIWDITAPNNLTIFSPLARTYNTTQILINFTASDNNTFISGKWFYNGSSNITYLSPVFVNLSEDVHTFAFYANDSANNINITTLTFIVNASPVLNNLSAYPNPILGGATIILNASAAHATNDTLQIFCSETFNSPVSANSICSGGNTLQNYPYNLSCSYSTVQDNTNHTVYCRIYDVNNGFYSLTKNATYLTQSTAPTTSVISVSGDTTASYFDTVNDGHTDILVLGPSGMSCRWSSSDLSYGSMSNPCTVVGTQANCSVNDVSSQGFTTRYVSCKDSLGNEQTSANNLDVSFYLDYTAPTTSDNSVSTVQVPNYLVTILESDNVDGDPKSYYCTSSSQGCLPLTSIDNGSQLTYTSSNRGANYLRYYSVDFAGNTQTIVNKTININQLPIFSSTNGSASIIKGGTTFNVSAVAFDYDSGQTIKLIVCNSTGANYSGCSAGVGTYCSSTGTANISCTFSSETDSNTHNWYASIFDSLNEVAAANPLSGSYTTDSTGPIITVVTPTNTTYTQSSLTVQITVGESVSSAWFSLNSGAGNTTMANSSSTLWYYNLGLNQTTYTIKFYANDSFGNIGSSSPVTFTISAPADTTPPAITLISPANKSYNPANAVSINITTDEALSWAGYSLNGGALVDLTQITSTNWQKTASLADESIYNLTVFANDSSHNQANKSVVFYTDSLSPRYYNLSATPSNSNISQAVVCSINWTDRFNVTNVNIAENSAGSYENHSIAFSGSSGITNYTIVGSKLTNSGTYNCIFYAEDAAANHNSTSVSFTVRDVTLPILTVTSPNAATYNQQSVTASLSSNKALNWAGYSLNGAANVTLGNTSSANWNSTISGLTDGVYTIIFYGNDSSNNMASSNLISFTISLASSDTTPPVILYSTISNGSYYTSTSLSLNITSNENLSWAGFVLNGGSLTTMGNISTTTWNYSLIGLTAESVNTLRLYANDTSNNQGALNTTFFVDTIAPKFFELNSTTPRNANETQTISCSAYVNDSFGFAITKISENASVAGTQTNHTLDLTSSGYANYTIANVQKGSYDCIFYVRDLAGNQNSTNVTFTVRDVSPPVISINSPLNSSYSTRTILFSITASEDVDTAFYSLDRGVTNVSLIGGSKSWSNTVTLGSDGAKTLTFFAEDTSGNNGTNQINFSIDTSVNDITPPTLAILSPANNSYYTSASVLLNTSFNENVGWAGYSLDNSAIATMSNTSSTSWNSTLNLLEGQHNITIFANDTSANKNQANQSVTIYVDLNNPNVTSFYCTNPVNDSVDVICRANLTDSLSLNYAIIGYNATGSWINSSQISLNGNISSNISYSISAAQTTMPRFSASISVFDNAGRTAATNYNITVADDSFPNFVNITYSPSDADTLDPGVTIKVNSTVNENYLIGYVRLMYKTVDSADWSSINMSNTTLTNYNGTFIADTNNTWQFRINATDAAGNQNISSVYSFDVANETSQNISTSIASIDSFYYAERSDNNTLGTLYLNNTGDTQLDFAINVSSTIGSRFNINSTYNSNATYTITNARAANITLFANTTGLTSGAYAYTITVTSAAGTYSLDRTLNIQVSAGPYFVVAIDNYPASVTSGDTGVVLSGSVTNLGSGDASNVSLDWSLPPQFSITSGSLLKSIGNLPIGVKATNGIVISVDSAAVAGSALISLNVNSAELNSTSDNKTIIINNPTTITQTINVPGPAGNNGGGGSIGGGGGGPSISQTIETVRGTANSFDITVNNKYVNSTLKNLKLNLVGYPAQYITITPETINQILPRGNAKFTVTIKSPNYLSYEQILLNATISGSLLSPDGISSDYAEKRKILFIINEISQAQSAAYISDAEKAIGDLSAKGIDVTNLQDLLKSAINDQNSQKYTEARDISKQITAIRDSAFSAENIIRRVAEAMKDPKKSYVLTGDVTRGYLGEDNTPLKDLLSGKTIFSSDAVTSTINLAIAAFERGDYTLANERAMSALSLLALERRGNPLMFIYMYWQYLLLAISFFSLFSILAYKQIRKRNISEKISDLIKEDENITELMKTNQEKYFSGKEGIDDFKQKKDNYESRLSFIKKLRLTLRNKRIKMLTPEEILPNLDKEKSQIEREVVLLQNKFYKKRMVSEDEYKAEFEQLNERLAEIEEERVTLQILKEKKKKRFGLFHYIREYFESKKIKEDEELKLKVRDMLEKHGKK